MAAQAALVSPEEYLRLEDQATERHEYVAGVVYAMAGASWSHVELIGNLAGMLYVSLRGTPCRAFTENVKAWIGTQAIYYYPDAVICCAPNVLSEQYGVIDNPRVVFEVLSASTASLDEGPKFAGYKTLESLRDYVLVDSRRVSVRVYSLEDSNWVVRSFAELNEVAPLPSFGLELSLAEIYDRVSFRSEPAEIFPRSV